MLAWFVHSAALVQDRDAPRGPDGESWRVTVGQWLGVLVAVLFVGPLFISNLWGYLQTRRYLTESAARNVRDMAAVEAAATADFVRGAAELVPALVARVPDVIAAIPAASDPDPAAAEAARQRLHDRLRVGAATTPDLDELQVVAATGVVLGSSRAPRPPAPDLATALCLQRGRDRVAVVGYDPGDGGAPQLLVATPARDGAVFCARFQFAVYQHLLTALNRRTADADHYLLDEQRRVIAASRRGAIVSSGEPLAWLPLPAGDLPWSKRGHGPDGQALSIAYSPVPGAGWAVVVAIPVATTLADLEALKRQALIVLISLVAVAALAVVLTWRTLVRPLRALSVAAERIAAGASGATVDPTGPREVSELGATFNRMSVALRESQQTLEDRIAVRTRELRESQEFAELLLDSIDKRVVVTDRDFRIVKTNNAAVRMHGRPLIGERCHEVFENRATPCEGCPVEVTFRTGRPATAERSQATTLGHEPMAIETYPVRTDGGGVESVIAISRVVSDEKQLQAKLAFQEKMAAFGQLAAGVAHELGNPLASIDAQLQRAEHDASRAATSVPIVRKEVGRMSRMLRELVDFARRKRDEVRLASPNQIIDDVIRLIEHDPRARNVEIVRALAPELPGLRLVEDHLVQVLVNLSLNALDALGQGGRLEYTSSRTADAVELRVRDSGTGIAPAVVGRLFEPFHTTKAAGRGTGLGLFVSKRIVDELGGQLILETTGPAGTTFVVRLPIATPGVVS